ncbi:MAG: hypothetical protein KDC38_16715 [Planctomycetes bacterium]|nr:hypothetical protein [Planctomycetota bacterium]
MTSWIINVSLWIAAATSPVACHVAAGSDTPRPSLIDATPSATWRASSAEGLADTAQEGEEPSPPSEEKPSEEPKPKGIEAPPFADPENRARFDEAVDQFMREEWRSAEKLMKECDAGESSAVQKELARWIAACKGGPQLAKVTKAIDRANWKVAWAHLERVRAKYGTTPLEMKIEVLTETIEPKIFEILATFEPDAPASERDAGMRPGNATVNTDAKYVRRGKQSLRWEPARATPGAGFGGRGFAYLPLAKIDGSKLEEFRYLQLSIYASEKDAGRYTLMLDTGQRMNMNPLQARCFYHHVTLEKPGWVDLRVDLWKEFQSYTNPDPSEVQTLAMIVIPPANPKAIYVDDVKLEKK